MHITLSPVRSDDILTLACAGDVLILNGQTLDLSVIPEGAALPAAAVDCPWLAGEISRRDGEIHLTVLLPHGARAPAAALFPAPVHAAQDGPIALPGYEMPGDEIEETAE